MEELSRPTEQDKQAQHDTTARLTRAQLLVAGIGGAVLTGMPSVAAAAGSSGSARPGTLEFPYYPQTGGTYTPESVSEITSNLLTIMYFAVTGTYATVRVAPALGLTGLGLTITQASLAAQQYAIDFLSSLVPGAAPRTTTFSAPPGLTSAGAVAAASEVASTIQVGATLAAVREFAELGQPTLAKYAAQLAGTQSEQRVLNRMTLALGGVAAYIPPNNKAFETDLFLYTRDALALLQELGFINGKGTAFQYPGRDAALAAAGAAGNAVIQRTPNNATSSVTPGDNLAGERS